MSGTRPKDFKGKVVSLTVKLSDYFVLGIWISIVLTLILSRTEFSGEGLRHIDMALNVNHPPLGTTRWLLFPTLIYGLITCFNLTGWDIDRNGVIQIFLGMNFLAGLSYLILLKIWLNQLNFTSTQKLAALALAASSWPMLYLSSDLFEPMIAGTIAVSGLVFASTHKSSKAFIFSIFAISVSGLLYQGAFWAIFLLPCAFPIRFWRKRDVVIGALIFILFSVVIPVLLLAREDGNVSLVLERLLSGGEKETFFRDLFHRYSIQGYVTAFVAGPPRGLVQLPLQFGLKNLIIQAAHPLNMKWKDILNLILAAGVFLLSWGVLIALIVEALKKQNWPWILGFGGLLTLPVCLSNTGYAYSKFYLLFPALIALGSCSLRAPAVFLIAAFWATVNLFSIGTFIYEDRFLSSKVHSLYSQFGKDDCFLTSSPHGPPYSGYWPGKQYNIVDLFLQLNNAEYGNKRFESSIKTCFCDSATVMTDNVATEEKENLFKISNFFRYHNSRLIENILWNEKRGETLFLHFRLKLRVYSQKGRLEICRKLNMIASRPH